MKLRGLSREFIRNQVNIEKNLQKQGHVHKQRNVKQIRGWEDKDGRCAGPDGAVLDARLQNLGHVSRTLGSQEGFKQERESQVWF